jgi:hypothetical protein
VPPSVATDPDGNLVFRSYGCCRKLCRLNGIDRRG